jgi:hypothetical protein
MNETGLGHVIETNFELLFVSVIILAVSSYVLWRMFVKGDTMQEAIEDAADRKDEFHDGAEGILDITGDVTENVVEAKERIENITDKIK